MQTENTVCNRILLQKYDSLHHLDRLVFQGLVSFEGGGGFFSTFATSYTVLMFNVLDAVKYTSDGQS